METASGVRMWQALRSLSDYCLIDRINSQKKADVKKMPTFIHSVIEAIGEEHENLNPNAVTFNPNNKDNANLEIIPNNAV